MRSLRLQENVCERCLLAQTPRAGYTEANSYEAYAHRRSPKICDSWLGRCNSILHCRPDGERSWRRQVFWLRSLRHRRAFRSVDPCIATPFKMYPQVPARPWEKSMERRRAARGRRGFWICSHAEPVGDRVFNLLSVSLVIVLVIFEIRPGPVLTLRHSDRDGARPRTRRLASVAGFPGGTHTCDRSGAATRRLSSRRTAHATAPALSL